MGWSKVSGGCQVVRVRVKRWAGAGPQEDLVSVCLLELTEELCVWPSVPGVLGVEWQWEPIMTEV